MEFLIIGGCVILGGLIYALGYLQGKASGQTQAYEEVKAILRQKKAAQ